MRTMDHAAPRARTWRRKTTFSILLSYGSYCRRALSCLDARVAVSHPAEPGALKLILSYHACSSRSAPRIETTLAAHTFQGVFAPEQRCRCQAAAPMAVYSASCSCSARRRVAREPPSREQGHCAQGTQSAGRTGRARHGEEEQLQRRLQLVPAQTSHLSVVRHPASPAPVANPTEQRDRRVRVHHVLHVPCYGVLLATICRSRRMRRCLRRRRGSRLRCRLLLRRRPLLRHLANSFNKGQSRSLVPPKECGDRC